MPNQWTFDISPIKRLVGRYLLSSKYSVDPFSGLRSLASVRNDLDPEMPAQFHLDAKGFLAIMLKKQQQFDLGLFDPPYSYRQASECYKNHGREHLTSEVTNHGYHAQCKDLLAQLICPEGVVISCGWNSSGMGASRGFEIVELLIVNHGAGHNDTIVTVERKVQSNLVTNPHTEEVNT
jgi:hypothetical protein